MLRISSPRIVSSLVVDGDVAGKLRRVVRRAVEDTLT